MITNGIRGKHGVRHERISNYGWIYMGNMTSVGLPKFALGFLLIAVVSTSLVALSACTGAPVPASTNAPTIESPSSTRNEVPVTSSPSYPTLIGIPVGLECSQIISMDRLYNFSPNFFPVRSVSDSDNPYLELPKKLGGVSCKFQGNNSSQFVLLSVARFENSSKQAVINQIGDVKEETKEYTSTAVGPVFFRATSGVGTVSLITGNYLVVASSPFFQKASDARDFVQGALSAIS